jgi:hypothetical protein
MAECYQTPGQNIKQHGESVFKYYENLNSFLLGKKELGPEWRIPSWLIQYQPELSVERYNINIFYHYLVYHDLGKPYCKIIDEEGKQHFPDHAQISYNVWMNLYQNNQLNLNAEMANLIGDLILHDMDLHIIKSVDLNEWLNKINSFNAISLLLAALCEIHSNAEMFGGIDSVSFKIKFKQIDKRGRKICQNFFGLR